MPFKSVEEAVEKHPSLGKYSDKAQRGWVKSFNSCWDDTPGDESKCFAVAWSTANKVDGKESKEAREFIEPVICVDMDGTILEQEFPGLGQPLPGAIEGLQAIRDMGWKIKVFTCRLNGEATTRGEAEDNYNRIYHHLHDCGVPFDSIATSEEGKPFAEFYIDDKGMHFGGDWSAIVQQVAQKDVESVNASNAWVKDQLDKLDRSRKLDKIAMRIANTLVKE